MNLGSFLNNALKFSINLLIASDSIENTTLVSHHVTLIYYPLWDILDSIWNIFYETTCEIYKNFVTSDISHIAKKSPRYYSRCNLSSSGNLVDVILVKENILIQLEYLINGAQLTKFQHLVQLTEFFGDSYSSQIFFETCTTYRTFYRLV